MIISAFLTPIPAEHLDAAEEVLSSHDFVLFGTEAFDFFSKCESGANVLIYKSHKDSEPVLTHQGIYRGYIGDPIEMKKLEKEGFRPKSTLGEKWSMYWKCSNIQLLETPIPFSEIQLASRKYLQGFPRGPIATCRSKPIR